MLGLLIAFIVSFICTLFIIRFESLHRHISSDSDFSAPQKFHTKPVPRIGGLSIAIGLIIAIIFRIRFSPNPYFELSLLGCAAPTFLIGITEDLTKKIGVKTRLIVTAVSALMAVYLLNAVIPNINSFGIEYLFLIPGFGIFFTILAITGLSNAFNIIDGFNGLASMVGIISLIAIAYINFIVGDLMFFSLSFVMIGAILGFFIWNYPKGSIFLGDGGSYLIGFWIATLSILLVSRNPSVSPWFGLSVNAYPILETLFTIYRRKIHQGKSPGQPDGIHFHSLIYRRVLKMQFGNKNSNEANSKTSPYLWVLSGVPVIMSVLFWNSSIYLIISLVVFGLIYIWIYQSIVKFKTPKWLHIF